MNLLEPSAPLTSTFLSNGKNMKILVVSHLSYGFAGLHHGKEWYRIKYSKESTVRESSGRDSVVKNQNGIISVTSQL